MKKTLFILFITLYSPLLFSKNSCSSVFSKVSNLTIQYQGFYRSCWALTTACIASVNHSKDFSYRFLYRHHTRNTILELLNNKEKFLDFYSVKNIEQLHASRLSKQEHYKLSLMEMGEFVKAVALVQNYGLPVNALWKKQISFETEKRVKKQFYNSLLDVVHSFHTNNISKAKAKKKINNLFENHFGKLPSSKNITPGEQIFPPHLKVIRLVSDATWHLTEKEHFEKKITLPVYNEKGQRKELEILTDIEKAPFQDILNFIVKTLDHSTLNRSLYMSFTLSMTKKGERHAVTIVDYKMNSRGKVTHLKILDSLIPGRVETLPINFLKKYFFDVLYIGEKKDFK